MVERTKGQRVESHYSKTSMFTPLQDMLPSRGTTVYTTVQIVVKFDKIIDVIYHFTNLIYFDQFLLHYSWNRGIKHMFDQC